MLHVKVQTDGLQGPLQAHVLFFYLSVAFDDGVERFADPGSLLLFRLFRSLWLRSRIRLRLLRLGSLRLRASQIRLAPFSP